jgi:5,10-methylenetetrahydromethanopterin reductase
MNNGSVKHAVGCYLVPGIHADPRAAIAEAETAQSLGLSSVWLSEKLGPKDLPALAGAVAARTESVQIGAAVTHIGLRHPLTIASMGHTLQALSGNRFHLGFGRAAPAKWRAAGVRQPTIAAFGDTAAILRRLWAGERVSYTGPAGDFPALQLDLMPDVMAPPLLMAAIGPNGLQLAGRCFDGVILHPFLTPGAVHESAAIARAARAATDQNPGSFRVIATVMIAPTADEEKQLELLGARISRYFMAANVRQALLSANAWAYPAAISDQAARRIPASWIRSATAHGAAGDRRRRLLEYLGAGADELILHGSAPAELAEVLSDAIPAT